MDNQLHHWFKKIYALSRPPVVKVSDKVMIPQEEHPDINFVGLLIGPRGNTLKAMEKDTGAKIIIRGKGSVKEGKVSSVFFQNLWKLCHSLNKYLLPQKYFLLNLAITAKSFPLIQVYVFVKVGRKDGGPMPGEDEPLHAYVTASNPESVKKAVDKVMYYLAHCLIFDS